MSTDASPHARTIRKLRRRRRWSRVLLVAAMFGLLAWMLLSDQTGGFTWVRRVSDRNDWDESFEERWFGLAHGSIVLGWRKGTHPWSAFSNWPSVGITYAWSETTLLRRSWMPSWWAWRGEHLEARLPAYIPACVLLALAYFVRRSSRFYRKPGVCWSCGYPRGGAASADAPCSECGLVMPDDSTSLDPAANP